MIFVTGGARSGKSALAEQLAQQRFASVTYIATAEPRDSEMRSRIAVHRQRRPAGWRTVEAPLELVPAIRAAVAEGAVLVDCLTLYLSNLLCSQGFAGEERLTRVFDRELELLAEVCRESQGRLIMVSNEVGMGIVPDNTLARTFRDLAGRANQQLAAQAAEVYFCVSGIPLKVK